MNLISAIEKPENGKCETVVCTVKEKTPIPGNVPVSVPSDEVKPLNDAATLEPENRFEFDFNTVSADVSELNKPFAKVSPQVPIQAPSTSEFVEGPHTTGRLTVPKIASTESGFIERSNR